MKRFVICMLPCLFLVVNAGCGFTQEPPGTLPEVDSIQKADVSDVGKIIDVALDPPSTYHLSFFYQYNCKSGMERLIIIDPPDANVGYCHLVVYETSMGGIEGLCDNLLESFSAKMVVSVNISVQEAVYFYSAILGYSGKLNDLKGLVDVFSPSENPNVSQFYFGSVSRSYQAEPWQSVDTKDITSILLYGNQGDPMNDELQDIIDVLNNIFSRYELAPLIE